MKVGLIYPSGPRKMGTWPPLGLGYIASFLENKGHEVALIDRASMQKRHYDPDRRTQHLLRSFNPDLVGITATTPLFPDACHCADLVKRCRDVPVIIGGPHASALAAETLGACEQFDMVCRGEGEMTMADLAAGAPPEQVAGISWRLNGEVRHNPPRPRADNLDDLPMPARHLMDMDLYLRPSFDVVRGIKLRATHIFTARGCPFRCTFCAGSSVYGRGVKAHSIDRVLAEVEHLISRYRVNGLYFAEDMFLFHKKRAIEICTRFIESGIGKRVTWSAQLHVNATDEELMRMMKQAGCAQIEFGFESGSQHVLDLMQKASTVGQNYRAAEIARRVGIRFLANIIVGMPGETRDDFEQTTKFLADVRPDYIGFSRFVPLPGSQIYQTLREQRLLCDDWTAYRVGTEDRAKELNLTEMSDTEFYGLFDSFSRQYRSKDRQHLRLRKRLQYFANQAHFALTDPGYLLRRTGLA